MNKLVLLAALVSAAFAQTCCNYNTDCNDYGTDCDPFSHCASDPAHFMYTCRNDPFAPWIADGWSVSGNYVYKNFESAVDYYTAQIQCGVKRGNLAAEVLRHPEVISHIYNEGWIHGDNGAATPWIGYTKVSGNWRWYDGGSTNPATTSWNTDEPNNLGGTETVAHIWSITSSMIRLNDADPLVWDKHYICEVKVL